MTDFNDRVEGEIKTHEKEMIRKAVITKYLNKSLEERMSYVLSIYDVRTDNEMFEKLTEIGLIKDNTVSDICDVFNKKGIINH